MGPTSSSWYVCPSLICFYASKEGILFCIHDDTYIPLPALQIIIDVSSHKNFKAAAGLRDRLWVPSLTPTELKASSISPCTSLNKLAKILEACLQHRLVNLGMESSISLSREQLANLLGWQEGIKCTPKVSKEISECDNTWQPRLITL